MELRAGLTAEGWLPKNWCFWIVVLEEALKSPLDCKEIKPINYEGNQPWVLTGRTDSEAEAPILWPSDEKRRLLGKDADVKKMWRQEEKGTTENEMGSTVSSKLPTWIWPNSGRQWKTGGPRLLWSMGSRRVGHDLTTKQQPLNSRMQIKCF